MTYIITATENILDSLPEITKAIVDIADTPKKFTINDITYYCNADDIVIYCHINDKSKWRYSILEYHMKCIAADHGSHLRMCSSQKELRNYFPSISIRIRKLCPSRLSYHPHIGFIPLNRHYELQPWKISRPAFKLEYKEYRSYSEYDGPDVRCASCDHKIYGSFVVAVHIGQQQKVWMSAYCTYCQYDCVEDGWMFIVTYEDPYLKSLYINSSDRILYQFIDGRGCEDQTRYSNEYRFLQINRNKESVIIINDKLYEISRNDGNSTDAPLIIL
jgi:hypothetical protein